MAPLFGRRRRCSHPRYLLGRIEAVANRCQGVTNAIDVGRRIFRDSRPVSGGKCRHYSSPNGDGCTADDEGDLLPRKLGSRGLDVTMTRNFRVGSGVRPIFGLKFPGTTGSLGGQGVFLFR